ncbi:MAG: phospholipid carrier-dependent glycosyltransferase [Alphaproteobacteria bacterium]|nr:phospholipid carrier-dependent glycosyltransferase [Alphaproteobacteria bacterium]
MADRAPAEIDLIDRLARGWRAYALIALVALAAAMPGFTRIPVTDRDEARFAQATRQMLETGDFVTIQVQDEPRHKKPIGIHWMQAAAVAATAPVTGGDNAIWAYRLPSLLGILIAALATFWGGAALVGRRAALIGAVLFSATLLASAEALIAKTDGMLCGMTALAFAAIARLRERVGAGRMLALIAWTAMGVGALVKGLTPIFVFATLAMLWAWERRIRWAAPLLWPPGPILAALIVAPWLVAIQLATDGAFIREAFASDVAPKLAGGQEGHWGPPGYHLALTPALFFPATLGLIPGLALAAYALRAPQNNASAASIRFLIAWIVPVWLLFECLPTKLAHYVLPAYPALALLAGAGLAAAVERRWRWSPALSFALFALGAVILVALNAYAVTLMPGDEAANARRAIQTALIGGAGIILALALMLLAKSLALRIALALAVVLVGGWSLRDRILPEARTVLISAELQSALHRNGLDAAPLTVIGYRETSLAFMTRTDIEMLPEADWEAAPSNVENGDALIIACDRAEDFSAALAQRALTFTPRDTVAGTNYANGDELCLQVGAITAAR